MKNEDNKIDLYKLVFSILIITIGLSIAYLLVNEITKTSIIGISEGNICYSPSNTNDCCHRKFMFPSFGGVTYDLKECDSGFEYNSIESIKEKEELKE